jgi:hypothetical protein
MEASAMEDQEKYEAARKRVEDIKGFYVHVLIYLAVNLLLFIINITSSPGGYWFYWPLLGWGIGVLIHGLSVFVFEGLFGKQWEEKKIKAILEKDQQAKK